jgi:hypothetical protein
MTISPFFRRVLAVDHDVIAVHDVLFDHGIALDLEGVVGAAAGKNLVRDREGFFLHESFDRGTSRDPAQERDLGGAGLAPRRQDFDGAALVVGPVDVAFRSRLVRCSCTVASDWNSKFSAISSKLGAYPWSRMYAWR